METQGPAKIRVPLQGVVRHASRTHETEFHYTHSYLIPITFNLLTLFAVARTVSTSELPLCMIHYANLNELDIHWRETENGIEACTIYPSVSMQHNIPSTCSASTSCHLSVILQTFL